MARFTNDWFRFSAGLSTLLLVACGGPLDESSEAGVGAEGELRQVTQDFCGGGQARVTLQPQESTTFTLSTCGLKANFARIWALMGPNCSGARAEFFKTHDISLRVTYPASYLPAPGYVHTVDNNTGCWEIEDVWTNGEFAIEGTFKVELLNKGLEKLPVEISLAVAE